MYDSKFSPHIFRDRTSTVSSRDEALEAEVFRCDENDKDVYCN